jgi:beta-lactamase class A
MDEAGRARVSSTRRQFLVATAAAAAASCAARAGKAPVSPAASASRIAQVESSLGGRFGVFAFRPGQEAALSHRADERFAMCSTFKWVLAAAVLARVDQGSLALDQLVPLSPSDLLEFSPTTRRRVGEGALPIADLAEAAVTLSDNAAANLLLPLIGGPPGLTQFLRSVGDPVSRLDRNEPTLNTNLPNDPRDTTAPRAMAGVLAQALAGTALAPPSRERLLGWLRGCKTGLQRLRAGLPATWDVGDKTGTGLDGAAGDVAVAFPPGQPPLFVAAYCSGSQASIGRINQAFAEIGRIAGDAFSAAR